ncbi:hypothetical protein FRACYDRAFT_244110 [Fragilariopsis cylindrus CCMP1102]|uniref:Uncharacterized protein n=1 Tax=Fragilariopsis cylindrus CCMP1102 TaxID=635003 RepID=A0A1E7F3W2_9STRA|nr:hypothetical protein FRACYDRAFT_244110 [Fragilariopsis cylindrus CCMP1102]|eukprot:OEU12837.1 hypothetical protein FRACYDRAFT_244110 [Fragilariopsis cylindrus CCMP1102]
MSLSWLGEQAQSQFLDRNLENHEKSQQRDDRDHHEGCSSSDSRGSGDGGGGGGGGGSFGSQKSFPSYQKLNSYNSLDLNNYDEKYTIRHQVIVWNVGTPDVKNNRVSLMFRVTLFWNDPLPPKPPSSIEKIPSTLDEALKAAMADSNANANANAYANANANANVNAYASAYDNTYDITTKGNGSSHDSNKDDSVWVMEGRNKAVRKKTRTENKRERNRSRSRRRRRKMSEDKNNDFEDDEEDDEEDEDEEETIDVPPVSIINAADFEIIGRPDITCLRYNNKPSSSSSPSHSSHSSSSNTRLMRFSCMYRASLLQEAHSMNVAQFPHDTHDLIMKLGILSQRQPNGRWDRRKWKLGLANESDTQGSIRVPYGVLVDHVAVPGFQISDRGLEFELSPIEYGNSKTGGSTSGSSNKQQYGSFIQNNFQQQRPNPNKQQQQQQQNQNQNQNIDDQDFCVKTKIRVKRNSAYYDRNIMPLLDILNLVSISILVAMDATNFFQRGLMCLNIAFLEIGLRTSLDARLPSVGYEIKMQKILNSYFYSILYIVLESAIMKVLLDNTKDNDHTYWTLERTRYTDHITAFLLLINQFYLRMIIYKDFSNNNNNNNNNYDNTSSSMSNTNNSTNKNSTNASGKGDGDGDEFK